MKNKFLFSFFFLYFFFCFWETAEGKTAAQKKSFNDSLQIYLKQAEEDTSKVNALNKLCWEIVKTGAYPKADSLAEIALKLAEKLNFKNGIANSYYQISFINRYQGNYPEALKNQFASLKLYEEMGNKKKIAGSYTNIGNIYLYQSRNQDALENYSKSLKISIEIADKDGISSEYTNIGIVYANQGRYKEALENYSASLKMDKEIGESVLPGSASTYRNIGNLYMKQGNFKDAENNFLKSAEICEEIKNKEGIAVSNITLGQLSVRLKKTAEAKLYLNKALALSKEIGSTENIKEIYAILVELDNVTGDYKAAFEHYKMYILYRDSLFNEENIKKSVQAEMNFNFQKTQDAEKLKQEKKEVLQQQEIRRQKIMRYSFTGGFAMVLLLALIIFRRSRQKQKDNTELESKNELIKIQKLEVELQRELLQAKNSEITDSISYARRIQTSFLTSEKYISQYLSDYFILNNPRNIVSGDFYWLIEKQSRLYVCTADCTGHGIPGAFMSLIAMGILNEIIFSKSEIKHTDEIFDELRRIIILALNPEGAADEGKDGMDAVLCSYDFQKMELEYSAANNAFYIIRNRELLEFKPDKMPIGKFTGEEKPFTRTIVPLEKGDCVYTFSDGYADQFGGKNGKKLMSKQFKELLLKNCHEPMSRQKEILNKYLFDWMGNLEQIDDILIIGIRL